MPATARHPRSHHQLAPGRHRALDLTLAALTLALYMLSFTKFRGRGADATLSGQFDAQILFELGCYAIIAAILLYYVHRLRHVEMRLGLLEVLLFGFAVFAVASSLWAAFPSYTLVRAVQLVLTALIPWVFLRVLPVRTVVTVCGWVLIAYSLVSALAALTFPWADGTRLLQDGSTRFSYFRTHPGTAGTIAAFGLLFALSLLHTFRSETRAIGSSPRQRVAFVAVLGVAVALIVLIASTYSRGAAFTGVFASLFMFLVNVRKLAWRAYFAAGLLAAAAVIGTDVLGQLTDDRLRSDVIQLGFVSRGQTLEQFVSLTGRTLLWTDTLQLVSDRLLGGYGYGSARSVLITVHSWAGTAHNVYIETVFGLGLIGTFLLMFPLLWVFLLMLKRLMFGPIPDHERALGSLLAALLAFNLVNGLNSEGFGAVGYGPDALIVFMVVFAFVRSNDLTRVDDPHLPIRTSDDRGLGSNNRPTSQPLDPT